MIAATTLFKRTGLYVTFAAVVSGCNGTPTEPEQALRAWVSAVQAAAEAKDRREILSHISPGYLDARGNNRDDIDKLLRAYFLRTSTVALLSKIDELTVFAESAALMSITVGMAGTDTGRLGFSADAYRFELEFEADGSDWLLTSARWGTVRERPH